MVKGMRIFHLCAIAAVAVAVFAVVCVVRTKCGVTLPVCAETAERLESVADRSLVRKNGMLYLDVGREWRIGATANRIISLAIANGSSFRAFLRR